MTSARHEIKEFIPDSYQATVDDLQLIGRLRDRDEAAFVSLIERHHASLLRLAMVYCSDRGVAEEVVQDTWVGVLRGLDRFEGRSSLKTWIFHILTNCAKTRARREGRTIPFSSLWERGADPFEPSVDPERFLPADHPDWPHHWASAPNHWDESPENLLLSAESRAYIEEAIATLPPSQREVITLHDVEGLSSEEVCNVLSLTETNQRVLLHRARSRVRRALEKYLDEGASVGWFPQASSPARS